MAGLDPAIQARNSLEKPRALNKAQCRDGRVKPGHDKAAALILAPMGLDPDIQEPAPMDKARNSRAKGRLDGRVKPGHNGASARG